MGRPLFSCKGERANHFDCKYGVPRINIDKGCLAVMFIFIGVFMPGNKGLTEEPGGAKRFVSEITEYEIPTGGTEVVGKFGTKFAIFKGMYCKGIALLLNKGFTDDVWDDSGPTVWDKGVWEDIEFEVTVESSNSGLIDETEENLIKEGIGFDASETKWGVGLYS